MSITTSEFHVDVRGRDAQTLLKNVHAILIIVIMRGTGKLVFKTGILFVVEWRPFCTSHVTPLRA